MPGGCNCQGKTTGGCQGQGAAAYVTMPPTTTMMAPAQPPIPPPPPPVPLPGPPPPLPLAPAKPLPGLPGLPEVTVALLPTLGPPPLYRMTPPPTMPPPVTTPAPPTTPGPTTPAWVETPLGLVAGTTPNPWLVFTTTAAPATPAPAPMPVPAPAPAPEVATTTTTHYTQLLMWSDKGIEQMKKDGVHGEFGNPKAGDTITDAQREQLDAGGVFPQFLKDGLVVNKGSPPALVQREASSWSPVAFLFRSFSRGRQVQDDAQPCNCPCVDMSSPYGVDRTFDSVFDQPWASQQNMGTPMR